MKPFCLVSLAFAAAMAAEPFRLPVPMVWQVNYDTLSRRQYIKDIDYLREHTRADILQLAPVEGVIPEDADQFHAPVKELVEYARSRGFREILRTSPKTRGVFGSRNSARGFQKGPHGCQYSLPKLCQNQ